MRDLILFFVLTIVILTAYLLVDDDYQDKIISNDEIIKSKLDSMNVESELRKERMFMKYNIA